MTKYWACICTSLSPFIGSILCLICCYFSYKIAIELHFYSAGKLSVLYRLVAGFQRFPCKKSTSCGNLSAKDCYYIRLFIYIYSIVTIYLNICIITQFLRFFKRKSPQQQQHEQSHNSKKKNFT